MLHLPAKSPDQRARYINLLEYLWGPVLVAAAYGCLYGLSDPAQEILIGLASDLATLWRTLTGDLTTRTDAELSFIFVRAAITIFTVLLVPVAIFATMRGILRFYGRGKSKPRQVIFILAMGAIWLGIAAGPIRAAFAEELRLLAEEQRSILALPGAMVAPEKVEAGEVLAGLGVTRIMLWLMATPGIAGAVLCLAMLVHQIFGWPWFRQLARRVWRAWARYFRVSPRRMSGLPQWLKAMVRYRRDVFARLLVLVTLVLAGTALIGFGNQLLAEYLGPISIASAFATLAVLGLGGLTCLSAWSPGRFPLILAVMALILAAGSPWAAVALAAITLSVVWLCWNQGRFVRWVGGGIVALAGLYAVGALLSDDCDTLPGCNMVQGVPAVPADQAISLTSQAYRSWQAGHDGPVRLVAAQGGGLYAAYHTAYYLAARADTEPDFARSVFAVSGVSGGSVGAGVFWGIVQTGFCPQGGDGNRCHRDAVAKILRHDYLSAALAGFFFRDNLDNILPISAIPSDPIDRGRTLEKALLKHFKAWADRAAAAAGKPVPDPIPLELGLSRSWAPDRGVPLLILNATDVDSGRNMALSPVNQLRIGVPGRLALPGGRDLSVATAMVASARFPLVSPPLRLRPDPDATRLPAGTRQLVDGGYFDNSGIESLMDFLKYVLQLRAERPDTARAPVDVILFSVHEFGAAERVPPMRGTVSAPLDAFTNAWRARRDLTNWRLEDGFARAADGSRAICILPATLREPRGGFTVSWFLADSTFRRIERQIEAQLGRAQPCS